MKGRSAAAHHGAKAPWLRMTDGASNPKAAMTQDRSFGCSTRALHVGTPPDPATGARAAPLYMSSRFVFAPPGPARELFSLRSYGTSYSRISIPTVAAF